MSTASQGKTHTSVHSTRDYSPPNQKRARVVAQANLAEDTKIVLNGSTTLEFQDTSALTKNSYKTLKM